MRTITPDDRINKGEVRVMAYWKGTVMFCDTLSVDKYNNDLLPAFKKDFVQPDDVSLMIEHLNRTEEMYCQLEKQSYNGTYQIDLNEAFTHLLVINDLVNNKKVIPNDNMFGLLIMAPNLLPSSGTGRVHTGNTNKTPKKKKRK